MTASKIDRDWFLQKLADGNKSVRGLARYLEVDASAVSRMLSGQRKMRLDEAEKIALFLNATAADVLSHAGVRVENGTAARPILLAATVEADGRIAALDDPKPLPSALFDRANAALQELSSGRIYAVQVRASEGWLSLWDDALLLFEPSNTIDPAAIGALSVCRSPDGTQTIGRIIRARRTGEAVVLTASGKQTESILETAAPILAVIP